MSADLNINDLNAEKIIKLFFFSIFKAKINSLNSLGKLNCFCTFPGEQQGGKTFFGLVQRT